MTWAPNERTGSNRLLRNESPVRLPLFSAAWFLLVIGRLACGAMPIEIAYSFSDPSGGGVASAVVEPSSGKILSQTILLQDSRCVQPGKLRRHRQAGFLALTNLTKSGPHLFLLNVATQSSEPFELPSVPDELRFAENDLLVSCEEDALAIVNWQPTFSLQLLKLDKLLSPPANGPEDVHVVATDRLAVITCQKDGKGGKKKGHRVILLQLDSRQIVADLPLPRNHPELHIEENNKESGPSPEVVYVSPRANTLIMTLDLYGAVGLLDWTAAKEGRVQNWTQLSTALNGTWGSAFPDRGTPLRFAGHDYFLVHNSGTEGGSCVVDLQKRRVVWQRPTPPGLEQPVYFPSLRKAFSVCSGKVKYRTESEVVKASKPGTHLYQFDFRSQQSVRTSRVEETPLHHFASRIQAASWDPPLLLIALGPTENQPDTLITLDPITMEVRDTKPAMGIISQFER